MPTKNYIFGALAPTAGLDLIEKQFGLCHKYRNRLVELDLERRKASDAIVEEMCPRVAELRVIAETAQAKYEAYLAECKAMNRQFSAEEGARRTGRKAKASIVTNAGHRAEVEELKQANRAAWEAHKATRKAAYASLAVKERLVEVSERHGAQQRAARKKSDLYWSNYQMVEETAKDFGKDAPPQYTSFRRTETHWVAAHIQDKHPLTPDDLLACQHGQVLVEDVTRPGTREGRKFVRLHLRVGSDAKKKPIFAVIPVLMHRPLPENAEIKWVKLGRQRIGTTYKWLVMMTVNFVNNLYVVPSATCRYYDSAPDGTVAVKFGAKDCDDGVEVATWVDDQGERGRVLIPDAEVGRFEEGERRQSNIDVITDVLRESLVKWMSGEEVVLPEHPFESDQKAGKDGGTRIPGLVGELPAEMLRLIAKKEEVLTTAQAAVRLGMWKSPDRFYWLLTEWLKLQGSASPERVQPLLQKWIARFRHLKDWKEHGGRQHTSWRDHLYRNLVAQFRRKYRTVVLATLTVADKIVRRDVELKVHGEEWTPPPDNKLRRVAACGRLRALLIDGAENPVEVKAKPKWTADDVMACPTRKSLVKVPKPRVRKKAKEVASAAA